MHSATRVISVDASGEPSTRVATLELACGCVVTRTIAADRLLDLGGASRAVGKYSCPENHPVQRPKPIPM
jgi:hypothetical protein